MKNKVAETRQLLKQVNSRYYKDIMLFNMGGNIYGLYDSNAEKIDGVRLAKGTLEFLKGYIFGKFGVVDL